MEVGSRLAPATLSSSSGQRAGSLGGGGGLPNGGMLPAIDVPVGGVPDPRENESSDSPTPAWQLQTKRALSDLWNLSCPEIEDGSGHGNKRPALGDYPGCSQPPSMPL